MLTQKGFSPVLLLITIPLLALIGLGLYLIFSASKPVFPFSQPEESLPSASDVKQLTPTPTPTIQPTSTPNPNSKLSKLFSQFSNYQLKDNKLFDDKNNEIETILFTNDEIGFSFLIPKKLYFKSALVPTPEKNLIADFSNKPETEKQSIEYEIDCATSPGDGVCSEGVPPWLSLYLQKNPEHFYQTEFEDPTRFEIYQNYKSIYISDFAQGSNYTIIRFLKTEGQTKSFINFSTKTESLEETDYKLAIWLLLNSLQIR